MNEHVKQRTEILDTAQAEGRTLTEDEERRYLDLIRLEVLWRELDDESWLEDIDL